MERGQRVGARTPQGRDGSVLRGTTLKVVVVSVTPVHLKNSTPERDRDRQRERERRRQIRSKRTVVISSHRYIYKNDNC